MRHRVTVEKIYHFKCGICRQTWSITNWLPNPHHIATCPHCATISEVKDVTV